MLTHAVFEYLAVLKDTYRRDTSIERTCALLEAPRVHGRPSRPSFDCKHHQGSASSVPSVQSLLLCRCASCSFIATCRLFYNEIIMLSRRIVIAVVILSFHCDSFLLTLPPPARSRLCCDTMPLCMGNGLNRARNKEAELRKKMERAKQQNKKEETAAPPPTNDEVLKEQNEEEYNRLLFAELLAKSQPVVNEKTFRQSESSPKADRHKVSAKRIKRKKKAVRQQTNEQVNDDHDEDVPLQQGDTAKQRHFESLVEVSATVGDQPLGAARAAQLVPWVPPGDLRQAIQYLTSNLPPEIAHQMIVISADSNEETQR